MSERVKAGEGISINRRSRARDTCKIRRAFTCLHPALEACRRVATKAAHEEGLTRVI